jgi:hypothetical protein
MGPLSKCLQQAHSLLLFGGRLFKLGCKFLIKAFGDEVTYDANYRKATDNKSDSVNKFHIFSQKAPWCCE